MDKSETLQHVSDATLQKPTEFEVDVLPQNFVQKALQKWGILPKKRVFSIQPIVLGSLMKISPILLSIDTSIFGDKKQFLEANYELMGKYGHQLALVLAIAIHNRESDPPDSLVNFIKWNFSPVELFNMVLRVRNHMEVQNFMNTIIWIRGLNVLESNEKKSVKQQVSLAEQGS
jgi:hypothetical protein